MYSSRGSNNTYGQPSQSTHPAHPQTSQTAQPYASQSAYRQNLGSAYSGSSVGGPDGASQLSMASRHSSMLGGGGPHETADIGGAYRAHPSAAAHYGGQYSSVYGSAALNSTQQSGKGAASSALESRRGYSSAMPESPKFVSSDYVSSASHGYGQKGDQLYVDRISDYPSIDRRQYGERSSAYLGREQNEPTGRYADSLSFSHQHQTDLYDRLDQASVLRQEQMLKVQSLQSNPLDGGSRQADYLATRAAAIRHPAEDLMSYAGRVGADPRSISMLSGSSQGGQQHAPSILGAAPRSNVEDLLYVQSSSNPGYGVSLPPGRDYATGKGLHAASLESDYPGSLLSRGSLPRMDDRTDERGAYSRELERKEEELRRDRLREREKERDRDKERERDRDRERERERERQRRRERTPKRREKERDREPKHGSEVKRERSPPRLSRDRRGSSLSKEGRSLRRDSPRHDVSHRRHSPVKEKRREYVCKVFASNLVEVQRDYLSIDKRYPRLFIAPEVSKVVVNWPKENVKLSLHTPVSFEHDFVEDEPAAEKSMLLTKSLDNGLSKAERGITLWNAKMILMSGLSQNALEELSSERSYDDRIPHYCNMLRFALLKKDNAFLAIGGPWDTIDGGDPSVDDSSLIRTVIRYAKALTGLDLTICQRWNRFLEIHYDRIGKDGLFSHKEVTVLYVPDLSDCLPSLEIWREQWLAHKKEIAERESKLALRKEKGGQKKEGLKGKDSESVKDPKSDGKSVKKKSSESPGQALDVNIKEKDGKTLIGTAAVKVDDGNKKVEEKDAVKIEEGKELEKEQEENPVQTSGGTKSGKKRIVRKRIVKQKASDKSSVVDNSTVQSDKLEEKDVGENNPNSEVADQLLMPSAPTPPTVKTFARKKVAKKAVAKKVVTKAAQKGVEIVQPEVISVKEPEGSEGNSKGKLDDSVSAGLQDASAKTTVKKKIIKRVLKRKVSSLETSGVANEITEDVAKDVTRLTEAENERKTMGEQTTDAGNQGKEVKSENKGMTKLKQASEKQDNANSSSKMEGKSVEAKKVKENSSISKKEMGDDEQLVTQKDGHAGRNDKSSEREKSKEENRRKDKDGKDETRSKSNRDVKEMKKPEEPPRRPGLFLQTKGSKNLRLRSLSLSLDSLLDYTTNDIEESTFELSVFAETLYEMLQYQMGSRILSFLQKMRIKFVTKRNKRKRQREESAKKGELLSPVKRVKTKESIVEVKPIKAEKQDESQKDLVESVKTKTKDESQADHVKTETKDESQADLEKAAVKEDGNAYIDEVMKAKSDDGTDEDEDPEEDQEEDEEMSEGSLQHESTKEEMDADNMNIEDANNKNAESDAKPEKLQENEKDENKKSREETSDTKPKLEAESKKEAAKTATKKKETQVVVDKELLEAFRFFDRNRVGYIRVEDMRLILHSMGKFMSHRDVKELVQSALLESNTGRNDQILYDKLVTMSGI